MNYIKRIQKWWAGKLYESDPNSQVVIIGYVYPKPRLCWEIIKKHIKKYWQFWGGIAAGAMFTIIGLLK